MEENKTTKYWKRGKDLVHNYQLIDNWDGNFCSDFCKGCGACSCFPYKYATKAHGIRTKQVYYYCIDCYEKLCCNKCFEKQCRCNSNSDKDEKCDKNKYDVVLYHSNPKKHRTLHPEDEKFCAACEIEIFDDRFIEEYYYNTVFICNKCTKDNSLKKLSKVKYQICRENFYCVLCEKTFSIITKGKQIDCENISKLKVYERDEYFIDANGKSWTKKVIQQIK